jgi:hypothetical protein
MLWLGALMQCVLCGAGVVRTWGRRPAVSTRAMLPGSEQLTDFAVKASR